MAREDDPRHRARQHAERTAAEIAASPSRLGEIQADEAAVLNGHCPEADPEDFIERRLHDLDA